MGMGLIMKGNKYIIILVLLILIVPFNLFLVTNISATWYNEDWDYYRTITIDSDFVDSELTNFPVLVSISDEIGDKCKDNGEDIVFVLPDNVTVLNHEIEKWADGSDRIVWVNVTTVTSDTDTVFLMYYGNADASDSQNPNDVWDSNFIAVYHMNSVEDSTIYDKELVNNGADLVTNGLIGSCYEFIKSNSDVMNNPSIYDISTLTEMTIEMIVNPDSEIATQTGLLIGTNWYDDSLALAWSSAHKSFVIVCNDASNRRYWRSSASYPDDGTWYHLVGTYTSTTVHVWVDGAIDEDTNYDDGDVNWGNLDNNQLRIGQIPATEYYDGHIDEIRISKIVRTDAWIEVTYHSQTQTIGFLTIGSEQEKPPEFPIQSNEYPSDGSLGIELTPSLHVLCIDADSENLYATWWSNSSGNWVQFASNWTGFASDTTITQTNDNFSVCGITYFWSLNLTDGFLWSNETYCFTIRDGWDFAQPLAWLIRNATGVTILKLSMSGNLAIAGTLYEQDVTEIRTHIQHIESFLKDSYGYTPLDWR